MTKPQILVIEDDAQIRRFLRATLTAEGYQSHEATTAADGTPLGQFTLTEPFDAVLLDDHHVFHGVTPVEPVDASKPAYRDVLVVTFRRV